MSDERSRTEPTLSDRERPMYESLPYGRSDTGEGTPWTLSAKISLSVMLAVAAIAGWHYYAHLQIEKAMQANADEAIANSRRISPRGSRSIPYPISSRSTSCRRRLSAKNETSLTRSSL
jgi:hypothetical protein